jgi:hypothetical protein
LNSPAPASDEVLKNTLANFAFEYFEMAAYKSLIAMAEVLGDAKGAEAAKTCLAEEQAMAAWIDEHIAPTTIIFLDHEATSVGGNSIIAMIGADFTAFWPSSRSGAGGACWRRCGRHSCQNAWILPGFEGSGFLKSPF